ncbi:MAG: hypothetical protein H3C34_17610 [Caldilineaceae bacterium]|nr:hypothetical protein [Caldilineaceae bacterium]
MFDNLPDLVDPLDGWLGRLLHGEMHQFTYLRSSEYTLGDIDHLLRRYGIRIWGRDYDDPEEGAFLVKARQAVWAEYILCRAGVPLTSPLLDPKNGQYRGRHPEGSMPTPWDKDGIGPHSLVDHVVDWVRRLVG